MDNAETWKKLFQSKAWWNGSKLTNHKLIIHFCLEDLKHKESHEIGEVTDLYLEVLNKDTDGSLISSSYLPWCCIERVTLLAR